MSRQKIATRKKKVKTRKEVKPTDRASLINRALRGYVIHRFDRGASIPMLVTMSQFKRAMKLATDAELIKLLKDYDL